MSRRVACGLPAACAGTIGLDFSACHRHGALHEWWSCVPTLRVACAGGRCGPRRARGDGATGDTAASKARRPRGGHAVADQAAEDHGGLSGRLDARCGGAHPGRRLVQKPKSERDRREPSRRFGQHRRRPGDQGHRRSHAGSADQRQLVVGQAAEPEAAVRSCARLRHAVAGGQRATGAGDATRQAVGGRLLSGGSQRRREVELRLGGRRLGGPPGDRVVEEPRRQLRRGARAVPGQPAGDHRVARPATCRWR